MLIGVRLNCLPVRGLLGFKTLTEGLVPSDPFAMYIYIYNIYIYYNYILIHTVALSPSSVPAWGCFTVLHALKFFHVG